jgi:DNA end-binding protein Ku
VDRNEVDPIYLDAPYYIYPDAELVVETFRIIGQAMAHSNKVGLGRVRFRARSGRSSLNLAAPVR